MNFVIQNITQKFNFVVFPCTMTHIDKIELQSLKAVLTSMKIDPPSHISRILSDIDLSLTYESILIYRYLNELFLCVNTQQSVDTEYYTYVKNQLINQIDLVIGKC